MIFSSPGALWLLPVVVGATVIVWAMRYWRRLSTRSVTALLTRLCVVSALVLALAGLMLQRSNDNQAVVFVGDISSSTASGRSAMLTFIDKALQARRQHDLAAVVANARTAVIEQPLSHLTTFGRFESVLDPQYTNLEAGLNLAGALLPVGYRKRIVLISDGRQNLGDAVAAATLLHARNIVVDVAPAIVAPGPETQVTNISVPSSLRRGEHFFLEAEIGTNVTNSTDFQILEDGQVIANGHADLKAGQTIVSRDLVAAATGLHTYGIVLQPRLDTVSQNNQAGAITNVEGPPRVLVVEGSPNSGINVAGSIRTGGAAVDTIGAAALSADLSVLQRYAAVVLVDVPADVLGVDTMTALRSFVHDLGHGLVVTGGTGSYGVGNYAGTPLEDVLPVSMDLPKRRNLPTAAVVLIIEDLESSASVDISKRAGEGVISLLNPSDSVAVSDAGSSPVVPLQHVTDRDRIIRAIENMHPQDPESYAPFLAQALTMLKGSSAQTKHIILLGDGDAANDTAPILRAIVRAGIQVSTIETNAATDSDFQTMRDIATGGHGKYYPADSVASIPQVFLKVAKSVAHSGITEGIFALQEVAGSPIVQGLNQIPVVGGYAITTPKPSATVVLSSPMSDPVLVQWQYGLGRAVAWTSDAGGPWTVRWLRDRAAAHIWSAMLGWVLPPANTEALTVDARVNSDELTISVNTPPNVHYSSVDARITGPHVVQNVALVPTAPGQYATSVNAAGAGTYFIAVRAISGVGHHLLEHGASAGIIVPYAPDYREIGTNTQSLAAIAAAGGGRILTNPRNAFDQSLPSVSSAVSLQWPLMLFALIVLPFDVAVRRLTMSKADFITVLTALTRRQSDMTAGVQSPSGNLAKLTERLGQSRASQSSSAPGVSERRAELESTTSTPKNERTYRGNIASESSSEPNRPEVKGPPISDEKLSAAARLLEAKRQRREP